MVDTQLRVYTHPRRSITMGKRRRTYTPEFKAEAVRLVTEQGYSVAEAARSLGVHETLLRSWKQALEAQGDQAFPGRGKLPAIEEELRRLRADNKRLLMERDILKKQRRSSPGRRYDLPLHRGTPRPVARAPALRDARGVRRRLLRLAGTPSQRPAAAPG